MRVIVLDERGRFAVGAVALAAAILAGGMAEASPCGERDEFVEMLKQRHGERPVQMAMTSDGRVLELWANGEGPWTLLLTSPRGYACVQATGLHAWEELPAGDPV